MDTPSLADIAAVTDKDDGGFLGGSTGGILALIIVFILLFGGGSMFGGGGNAVAAQYVTQQELQAGFNQNTIVNKLDGIGQGICSLGYENAQLANQTNANITQLGYMMQDCCCKIQTNADHNTQAILNKLCDYEVTQLRDQLQSANLALFGQATANNIVSQVRPTPIPAWPVCSPYTSACGCCA